MIKVEVNAGVCGFHSTIRVDADKKRIAQIEFTTACPALKPLEEALKEANGLEEVYAKVGESSVFELSKKFVRHAACPVPTAIVKGIEAACGLALPRDVEIKVSRE